MLIKSKTGTRLKQLRKEHKLTQSEYCDIMDISRSTLIKIEKNEVEPSFKSIKNICDYFQLPIDYFEQNIVRKKNIIFRSAQPFHFNEFDYERIDILIGSYLRLEEMLNINSNSHFPIHYPVEAFDLPRIYEASRLARNLFEIGMSPILNLYDILESQKIRIISLDLKTPDISGFSLYFEDSGFFLFLNRRMTEERKIYTLAHELGHVICHQRFYTYSLVTEKEVPDNNQLKINESIASEFAAEFLMPKDYLTKIFNNVILDEKYFDFELLIELKQKFSVSAESMMNRLMNLKLIREKKREELKKYIKEYYQKHKNSEPGPSLFQLNYSENKRFWNLFHIAEYQYSKMELKKIKDDFSFAVTN